MPAPLQLTFGRSTGAAYPRAVALAREQTSYTEAGDGRTLVHAVAFGTTAAELSAFLELWDLVKDWKATRLQIAGVVVLAGERWTVTEILTCAARAATFDPPRRYCASAPGPASPRWPGRPPFPCRHLVERWGYYLDERIDWSDLARRGDQLRALLAERGIARCPFLVLGPFLQALETWRPAASSPRPPGGGYAGIVIRVEQAEPTSSVPDSLPSPEQAEPIDETIRRLLDGSE